MKDRKIEKIAAIAVNITKVLVIVYLGFVEVFKIGKLLREKLDAEFDISRKWASQNYSILKKRLEEQKLAGALGLQGRRFESCRPDSNNPIHRKAS